MFVYAMKVLDFHHFAHAWAQMVCNVLATTHYASNSQLVLHLQAKLDAGQKNNGMNCKINFYSTFYKKSITCKNLLRK
jgi:hypothetical protein